MAEPFLPRVTRAWYIACESAELRRKPLARSLFGTPLVIFRDDHGRPGALLDRCAHRNVPLSLGRVVEGRLECAYHGWQYDIEGNCVRVPGLCAQAAHPSRFVPSYAVREKDGYVWVFATPGVVPNCEPYKIPEPPDPGYTVVRRTVEVEASLTMTFENALDVPHTAFLHRGLFRGAGRTNRILARVTRTPDGVQAEYIGEPRPSGLAGRLLSPSGGIVTHFDRFILPSIIQVEYRLGPENHLLVTSVCTPVEDFRTRMYATILLRTRFPGWLVKLFLNPVATRIFRQDAEMLKRQTDAVKRFGGEHYASTAADVLGLQIARLLRMAEAGTLSESAPEEWAREIEMEV